jgi:hypothetical protein
MRAYWYVFLVSVVLTICADLLAPEVVALTDGGPVLLPALVAGVPWAITCLIGPRRIVLIAIANAVLHAVSWLFMSSIDTRTFFGGAMMPILSFWGWVLVSVVVVCLGAIRLRRLRCLAAEDAAETPEERPELP